MERLSPTGVTKAEISNKTSLRAILTTILKIASMLEYQINLQDCRESTAELFIILTEDCFNEP